MKSKYESVSERNLLIYKSNLFYRVDYLNKLSMEYI